MDKYNHKIITEGNKKSLTINPPYMNQLIGAVFASIGIYKCVPLVHGSLGCANYVKHILVEHFKEPLDIATTGFYESNAIHGGISNLNTAIENIEISKNPELIVVLTTGLIETIGEDVKSEIRKNYPNKNIVAVNTPSYIGTHIDGYNNAVKSIIEGILEKNKDIIYKTSKTAKNEIINVIPGIVNPGDVHELEHIFKTLNIKYNLLTDIKALDRPLILPKEEYPKCNTTVDNIKNAINSKATISFGIEGVDGGKYLKKFGVASYNLKYPIGVKNTDDFIKILSEIFSTEIPDELWEDRGYALDAMVDTNHIIRNKKVAIYGDPDKVIGLVDFAHEMGMDVVAVLPNTKTKYFAKEIKRSNTANNKNTAIIDGDLYELQNFLKSHTVDLLIGDYRGKYVVDILDIPLLRVGFPVIDRYGHTKKPMIGYNGAMNIANDIANILS
ncbi:nitrogenase component 1 [Methanothermococcus okinawensis]|uniref:Nitrogenase n=1 Tax=Methanothermococcus okinawensis (strain DSM 14208 / JCM 11175 / IH1) TaxID=647113 RepID=F8ANM3_METOI|nr:nitrogenase component 1 [Methanothermococcus okinawensis]AEH07082.1 Nitrogenase [Methanothermococcus okinawensis IH1]